MGILTKNRANVFIVVASGMCGFFSCMVDMPDTFARIDAYKLRVVGVTVSPRPEVSPGDTVTITAYFGGNEVVSISDIKVCHDMIGAMDGSAYKDAYQVSPISPPRGLPDSAKFSFVVKKDVFIGRQGYDSIAQSTSDSIAGLFMHPKDSVDAMVSALSDSDKSILGTMTNKMVLPAILLFTARSANGSVLSVLSRFAIKYHPDLPGITPPNNNPDISWVGVCKVPDAYALGFSPFDPESKGKFTMTYLYNKNNPAVCDSIVVVDTGLAYFLVTDNGISQRVDSLGTTHFDTLWESLINPDGSRQFETYLYHWFYQNVDVISDDSMAIDAGTSASVEMKPPLNRGMKRFRVWAVASDDGMSNQRMRPRGTCVRSLHGEFNFTDAYKEWIAGQ
jgi:hypothetical protein